MDHGSANQIILDLSEDDSDCGLELWDDDDTACLEISLLNGPSAYSRRLKRTEIQQIIEACQNWLALHA